MFSQSSATRFTFIYLAVILLYHCIDAAHYWKGLVNEADPCSALGVDFRARGVDVVDSNFEDVKYVDAPGSDRKSCPIDAFKHDPMRDPYRRTSDLAQELEESYKEGSGEPGLRSLPVLQFFKNDFLRSEEAKDIQNVKLVHVALAKKLIKLTDSETEESVLDLYKETLAVYTKVMLEKISKIKENGQLEEEFSKNIDRDYVYVLGPTGRPLKELVNFWVENIVTFERLRDHPKIRRQMQTVLYLKPNSRAKELKALEIFVEKNKKHASKAHQEFLIALPKFAKDHNV